MKLKCRECNSCMNSYYIDNQLYFFCSLCHILLALYPNKKLERIDNEEIKNQILEIIGNKVV